MANWIVINVTFGSVHFRVVDENGETVFNGSEPVGNLDSTEEASRAGVQAMGAAFMWASAHGGVEGYEIIG